MRIYMARQPIYRRNKVLYAYELLYRDSERNAYNSEVDGSRATRAVLSDALTTFGLHQLTYGKLAFVNFTRELLLQGLAYMLDPRAFVIEILEDVYLDDELVECIKELKHEGYTLALDDYTGKKKFDVLFEYVDIIKVDFKLLSREKRTRLAKRIKSFGIQLLAEKIETELDYEQAVRDGYEYFQGYYFAKAMMVSIHSADAATVTCMRMLSEIAKTNPDYKAMAEIIRRDVNLTYKLLRRINTIEYYRSHRVTSTRSALVRMGIEEVKRWILFILIREITGKGTDEMTRISLIRGFFAEKIAEEISIMEQAYEAFTTGMFSMIDLIMEESLSKLLADICLSDDVKDALLGKDNTLGKILQFVIMYERGNWELAESILCNDISLTKAANYYLQAVQYADLAIDERPYNYAWTRGTK